VRRTGSSEAGVVLHEAAADLLSFGPDWDETAQELKARATRLEQSP